MPIEHSPPRAVPELVGEEDVSKHTDRSLILRIANDVLELQYAVGRLAGEVGTLARRLLGVEARADADLSGMFRLAAAELQARVNNPHDRLDAGQAKVIAEQVVQAAKTADKAGLWDDAELRRRERHERIRIVFVTAAVSIVAAALAAHFGWK